MTEGTFSNNVLSLSRPAGALNIDMSAVALKSEVQAIGITSAGNQATVNNTSTDLVKSVGGTVSNGNLKITVNGVESADIPLPESNIEGVLVGPIVLLTPTTTSEFIAQSAIFNSISKLVLSEANGNIPNIVRASITSGSSLNPENKFVELMVPSNSEIYFDTSSIQVFGNVTANYELTLDFYGMSSVTHSNSRGKMIINILNGVVMHAYIIFESSLSVCVAQGIPYNFPK